LESISGNIGLLDREARDVAARSRQIGNEAAAKRIIPQHKHDGDRRCCLLHRRRGAGIRDDKIGVEPGEFGGELRGALGASFRPTILDRDGASLDPAEFTQSRCKRSGPWTPGRGVGAYEPDHGQLARLLCARRDRPGRCRAAAKQDDEIAPSYA
jgi:hypothetical protein